MAKKEEGYTVKTGDIELVPVKPENEEFSIWDIDWEIRERKDEKRLVGHFKFLGAPERGKVGMEFDIDPRFNKESYGKDAVKIMVDWAFARKGIYEVTASCDPDNDVKVHTLEKSGFVFRTGNKTIEHYSVTKPKTSWLGLYVFIGFCIGLMIGITLDNMIIGMIIGLVMGFGLGTSLDQASNKERSKVTGEAVKYRRLRKSKRREQKELEEQKELNQELVEGEVENGSYFIKGENASDETIVTKSKYNFTEE